MDKSERVVGKTECVSAQDSMKKELLKLISRSLGSMEQLCSSEGLDEYDIDVGYQKQHDCDVYWYNHL